MNSDEDKPEIRKIKVSENTIKILSPTDCIKDRLYKADEWDDDEAFDAAVLVASKVGFNQQKARRFFELNNKIDIFERFIKELDK